MTAVPKPPHFSPQEMLRLEEQPGVEFVNGQVVEKPVSVESADVEAEILMLLRQEARRTGAARVFSESLGYRCYRNDPTMWRRPDVSVVRIERLAGLNPRAGFLPIPADLVVEVVSPNNLAYAVNDKVREYLSNGFPLVWVVHPDAHTVTIHRADGSVAILSRDDEITAESALPTFKCKVSDFFPPPFPPR